jgi:hypothetical protein
VNLVLVLRTGPERDPLTALPGGTTLRPSLVPEGFDPRVAPLALLGQDPRTAWTGPAGYGIAAAKAFQAEDEAAYLLTPVRAAGGAIEQTVRLGRGKVQDLLEWLGEELIGEAAQLVASDPPLLLIAEAHVGPSAIAPAELSGRRLDELPSGPPAVLQRVIEASRKACLELGGAATHLFPNSPGSPTRVQPLRETWLGLGASALVGDGPDAQAIARLLGLSWRPLSSGGLGLREALHEVQGKDLVVVWLSPAQAEAFGPLDIALPDVPNLAVAWPSDREGAVPLTWLSRDGSALGEGFDLLRPLALR